MNKRHEIWLKAGYLEFARSGPEAINIDKLAQMVGKSRSSLYHLFGDLKGYQDDLCDYHWQQSQIVSNSLDSITSFFPEFANLIEENKEWTFFHVQTFKYCDVNEKCGQMFLNVTELIEPKVGHLWAQTADLGDLPVEKTKHLYRVIRETVFTRLTYDNFTQENLKLEIERINSSIQILIASVEQQ